MAAYCCLCLEDLNDVDGDGAGVEAAPCGHVFHKTCIRRALAAKKKCPSCRDSCTAGQLIKLFVDYRDTASDHAGPSAPDVIETDLVDDGDTKRQTSQLKEDLAGLQRKCTVLEAQRDRAAGASEEMREQHTTLTEENYILRDQLRKNEETRRMYSIEKSGMKHKLDQGERSLQQAHDRNAKLMDEKKDLEGKIALSRLSDESISEAEIVELHTNLLKVVDHKKILLEQARNIVRLNKSNGGLIEQVKGLAFAKGELDRKSRAYKQLQASYLQLQSELARLQEARQQEAKASDGVDDDVVGAAFMDDDWSQPASIQDTAEASHSRSGGMSTGVVSSHSHSSLRIMRPSGLATGGPSKAAATMPSFVRASPAADESKGAGRYIVSGADGRGGRQTQYRPGATAQLSSKSREGAMSMSSWGAEDELSSSRFAKKRPRPKGDAGGGKGPLRASSSAANSNAQIKHFFASS